jgi:isopentenyl-diphosphate delta-isomerase
LKEEMGIVCPLKGIFAFTYCARVGGGLTEHERDYVFVGKFDGDPTPDKSEVQDCKWIATADLLADLEQRPEVYAYWFRACAKRVIQHWNAHRLGAA